MWREEETGGEREMIRVKWRDRGRARDKRERRRQEGEVKHGESESRQWGKGAIWGGRAGDDWRRDEAWSEGKEETGREGERGLVTKHVNHPKTSNKHCAPSNYKYVMHIL